ncbi:MAG: hypothetical protein MI746_15385 [Pseudomonadales bacterium]|nr:hypothetical protein [Pseudomonadales bacterium]
MFSQAPFLVHSLAHSLARSILFVVINIVLVSVAQAQGNLAEQNDSDSDAQPATIVGTEEFTLYSEIVGSYFLIQVAKPFLLAPPSPDQKFPVVYVTDGITNFTSFSSPARALPLEGSALHAYVVAVGYPPEVSLAQQAAVRMRDLLHESVENIPFADQSGGGDDFERFLIEELRPEIERRYPVDSARSTLAGHSLGGLFAATVLRNDPNAFSSYMIGSPSLQFDPDLIDELRSIIEEDDLAPKIFLSVGRNEGRDEASAAAIVAAVDGLEHALSGENSSASVRRVTFDDETHMSVVGAWISHGLRFVLNE